MGVAGRECLYSFCLICHVREERGRVPTSAGLLPIADFSIWYKIGFLCGRGKDIRNVGCIFSNFFQIGPYSVVLEK